MRPIAAILALLATAGPLAACGKGQRTATRTITAQATTPPTATTPPPAAGGTTKGAMTKAQALAFARAVNLQPADLPGYRGSAKSSKESTPAEQRLNRELQHCVGAAASEPAVAELDSMEFERGASVAQQSVSSSVTVARSSADAIRELNRFRSARMRTCFTRYLMRLFESSAYRGATIGPVSIAHGTPPAQGTSGSFGWRVSTTLVVRSVRIPFYLDILGFVYGPGEVTLLSTGIPVPFPAATEQRLFLTLLARAKAQHLP